jgi:DNA modification methylase
MTIIQGDCFTELNTLMSESVDCIVTSPPYFGQRIYTNDSREIGKRWGGHDDWLRYIGKLALIFKECQRVLKPTGTLWIVIGDKYSKGYADEMRVKKCLMQLPARLAIKLTSQGWILRNDIIWHKTNPMPESVKDRCTYSHEHILFLTKSQKYLFYADRIKTKSKNPNDPRSETRKRKPNKLENGMRASGYYEMANARDVWSIPTQPFKGAHTATFPEELVRRCILAGCPEDGVVLDPFFGVGTTGLVAKQLGRKFIGIEINGEYIDIAKKRIANA